MTKQLASDDGIAILKHYDIDVAEGHQRNGTSISFSGAASANDSGSITVTIGDHSANRLVPVTEFLAEGLVGELADPQLKSSAKTAKTIAHLVVKLSHMYEDSHLASFALTAFLEGDHYEILPKSIVIEPTHATTIPHRLDPHAHDRGAIRP